MSTQKILLLNHSSTRKISVLINVSCIRVSESYHTCHITKKKEDISTQLH